MRHLERVEGGRLDPEPVAGGLRPRRFVAQRLEQAPDAPAIGRRSEQHRHAKIVARLARQVGENGAGGRGLVHQQLFEQRVVMVGELFEHMCPLGRLALGKIGRDRIGSDGLPGE